MQINEQQRTEFMLMHGFDLEQASDMWAHIIHRDLLSTLEGLGSSMLYSAVVMVDYLNIVTYCEVIGHRKYTSIDVLRESIASCDWDDRVTYHVGTYDKYVNVKTIRQDFAAAIQEISRHIGTLDLELALQ